MKLYKNVLSEETIKLFLNYINENLDKKCWSVGSLFWPSDLLIGVQGSCVASDVPVILHNKIISEIKTSLPMCNEIMMQAYFWGKNAGISKHNDQSYKFGATIYMNDHWSVNDGGIFLWTPNGKEEYKVIIPEFNSMVVNDEKEFHLVTPVSPYITTPRLTIQIWGLY